MWHLFEGNTANELWGDVFEALRRDDGARVQPSRVGGTREILHAALTLRNPRERWVSSRRPAMNPAFALAEVFWILSGRRDAKFLSYFNRSLARHAGTATCLNGAYGYRLRHRFRIDQLCRACDVLRANPNSRQVVLQIWHPADDLPHKDGQPQDADIPCNTQSILKVREGKLEWLQIIRSNDAFLGLPHNLVQFTMLQEVLSGWLGIEPGQYHQVSDSLHVYESDLVSLRQHPSEVSSNSDVFALPQNESAAVISVVVKSIEQIIDEQQSAEDIFRLADTTSLPDAYRNALRIMIAEGARRRKDPAIANAVMSLCTSPMFCQMWTDWCGRLQVPK
jgi:thymidylate synthase